MAEIDLDTIKEAPVPGETETAAERFDPARMRGELIEAEHLARYRFAAQAAPGKRVLDAGCGWGYGANMLAAAGAQSVVGVEIAETIVEAAAAIAVDGVEIRRGDVTKLDFAENSFDLIVCFEVIEHVEKRGEVLAEFARVLAPGGLLLISSPNRDVYGDRNPFHVFEYTAEEFDAFVGENFAHHRVMLQENWITSLISTIDTFKQTEEADLGDLQLTKTVGRDANQSTYLVAVASQEALPDLPAQTAVMTDNTELLKWHELWAAQDKYLQELQQQLNAVSWDTILEIRSRLERRESDLIEAESIEHDLRREIAELRGEIETVLTEPVRRHVWRRIKLNRVLRKIFGRDDLS
ncbi:MAG: methyltransferase domain-containing protein [Solirubrobacterales bacterium]